MTVDGRKGLFRLDTFIRRQVPKNQFNKFNDGDIDLEDLVVFQNAKMFDTRQKIENDDEQELIDFEELGNYIMRADQTKFETPLTQFIKLLQKYPG